MKRAALIVGLLLPLSVGAAAPSAADKAATNAPHLWPPLATATGPVESIPDFSLSPPSASTDSSLKVLREIERNPSPPATVPSLAHIDLNSHVRLAFVTRPKLSVSIFGTSRTNVSLFSLQW